MNFQNIENGKGYKLTLYVKSTDSVNINVALTNSDGSLTIATANIV
jgi:alpha-L-arabinofuranosidase